MKITPNTKAWDVLFRGREIELSSLFSVGEKNTINYKGDIKTLLSSRPRVAIVGTKDISLYGIAVTRKIIDCLSQYDEKPVIISGFAMGVDTEAHRAALEKGLPTVAVVATGLDTVYPFKNKQLAEYIETTTGCCIISQFPEATAPMAFNFLKRNHVIAAIADVVIVVESKERGGAIVTAKIAHSMDIPVFAVPGRIDDVRSAGCNDLIRKGVAKMFDMSFLESYAIGKKQLAANRERSLPAR